MNINTESMNWYSAPIFSRFWEHYNYSNQWMRENGYNVIEFVSENDRRGQSLPNYSANDYHRCDYTKESDNLNDDMNEYGDESDDISHEYLQFIIETKRHQKERERLLKEKLKTESKTIEYIDISKLDSVMKKGFAPKENVQRCNINAERDEQMKRLYGHDANVIQGMESALQLNFNSLYDLHEPKCWPIMPIRM